MAATSVSRKLSTASRAAAVASPDCIFVTASALTPAAVSQSVVTAGRFVRLVTVVIVPAVMLVGVASPFWILVTASALTAAAAIASLTISFTVTRGVASFRSKSVN